LTAARRSSDQWEQQLRHEPHRPGGVRHEVLCRRVESVARRIENAVTPWSRRRLGSSSHGVRSARTPPTPASHRIEKQGAPGSGDYETARSFVNAAVPLRAPAHRSSEPRVPGIRSLSLAPRSHRILVRAQVRWGPPVRALERPDLRPPSHRWPSLVSVAWRIDRAADANGRAEAGAVRPRRTKPPWTYSVTSSVAARLPRRASCLRVPLTAGCFAVARKLGRLVGQ
jgi:hypothetical protein